MMLMRHTIAGIRFLTEADVALTTLQKDWLHGFAIEETTGGADVFHLFRRIEEKDLVLPALSAKERDCILRFNLQTQLGPGSFILPPFVRNKNKGEDRFSNFQSGQDPLDAPLLRSPLVRERLEACLDYPEQIRLTLHLYLVEIYDYRLRRIDVFYRPEMQWALDNYPLENGLRRMFTSFLPSFSCVMLHSSGIIRNNRAGIFLAPDAGGKSTVLKNRAEGIVLSDDQNVVRKDKGIFTVYSTPWGHLNSGPQNAPLGGLFFLEKAPEFKLISIKPKETFEFIWQEHMHVWDVLPKNLRIEAFDVLTEICYHTPCYRMQFPKDYVDWDAIDSALGN